MSIIFLNVPNVLVILFIVKSSGKSNKQAVVCVERVVVLKGYKIKDYATK